MSVSPNNYFRLLRQKRCCWSCHQISALRLLCWCQWFPQFGKRFSAWNWRIFLRRPWDRCWTATKEEHPSRKFWRHAQPSFPSRTSANSRWYWCGRCIYHMSMGFGLPISHPPFTSTVCPSFEGWTRCFGPITCLILSFCLLKDF
jgi:hypothetical protein